MAVSSVRRGSHIKCKCGGIIGRRDTDTFSCDKCSTEFQLHKLDYDVLFTNDKTGWIFPMKFKEEEPDGAEDTNV